MGIKKECRSDLPSQEAKPEDGKVRNQRAVSSSVFITDKGTK